MGMPLRLVTSLVSLAIDFIVGRWGLGVGLVHSPRNQISRSQVLGIYCPPAFSSFRSRLDPNSMTHGDTLGVRIIRSRTIIMKIVNLDTLKCYKPPCGYEILGIRQLDDGSYE